MRVLSGFALFLATPSFAQLALPSPAILPPPAASGAILSKNPQAPNPQWSTLLNSLLYFYEAQRSGKLPSTNRVPWRNSTKINDGNDIEEDLTGGYFDAGNYLKCTYPLSFVLTSVCWGAIEFGTGYDNANQTAYLDDMLRWGLNWMIKAHPSANSLVVQVGDVDVEDRYWGGDQNIPTKRPSYLINNKDSGTDAAAAASAAFSTCSILYSGSRTTFANSAPASLADANYSSTLQTHADQLFSLATSSSYHTFTSTIRSLQDVYPSSGYWDELVLAGLMLGAATNSGSHISQALEWYREGNLAGQDNVFNWDSKGPGLPIMFAQLAKAQPQLFPNSSSLSDWQGESETYFDRIVEAKGRAKETRGGLLFYDGDSDTNSLNPALNAAMLMLHYAPLATTDDKRGAYTSFARKQITYALGNNPMNLSYVVGSSPNSPSNPHSAPASGGSNISTINTEPKTMAHVLYGAVVGGPDKNDTYFDVRNDWRQSEVALDYNAPMLTLTAASVLTESEDPFYTKLEAGAYQAPVPTETPCDDTSSCGGSGNSAHGGLSRTAIIALAAALGAVGLLTALAIVYTFLLRKRMSKTKVVA